MNSTSDIAPHLRLGNLCWQLHDHEGTGQSLRYRISGECAHCACEREFERRRGIKHKKKTFAVYSTACEKCGKVFRVKPGKVGGTRYCSRSCQYEGQKIDPLRPVRRCPVCQEIKPRREFFSDKNAIDGLSSTCRACRRFNRPGIKKGAGLTPQQFRDWFLREFEAQGGLCAICCVPLLPAEAMVDHDHETGKLRGLLCTPCNFAIGLLKDNPDILERGAHYVRSYGWTVTRRTSLPNPARQPQTSICRQGRNPIRSWHVKRPATPAIFTFAPVGKSQPHAAAPW